MSEPAIQYYSSVKEKLLLCGLKITQQRLAIYQVLLQLNHPTADAVFAYIRPANPSISLGTIYKTLDTFVEKKLISKVLTNKGSMRYDAHSLPHSHIYCVNTNEIIDFNHSELDQLIESFFQQKKVYNLKINNVVLQINAEKINPDENISIKY